MIINAAQFPGPALWFGLMLCALPVFVHFLNYERGKYESQAIFGMAALGVVLFLLIVVVVPLVTS